MNNPQALLDVGIPDVRRASVPAGRAISPGSRGRQPIRSVPADPMRATRTRASAPTSPCGRHLVNAPPGLSFPKRAAAMVGWRRAGPIRTRVDTVAVGRRGFFSMFPARRAAAVINSIVSIVKTSVNADPFDRWSVQ